MPSAVETAPLRAELAVRRSAWFLAANLAVAAGVLALVLLNIAYQWQNDGPIAVAALFVLLVAVYAAQTARQLILRAPVVIVGPAGLTLPTAHDAPIPWADIGDAALGGWPLRSQVDLALPAETVMTLTLGQRYLGDAVIKRRGLAPGITIVARGLDRDAASILAAIHAFTPRADAPGPFVGSKSRE